MSKKPTKENSPPTRKMTSRYSEGAFEPFPIDDVPLRRIRASGKTVPTSEV